MSTATEVVYSADRARRLRTALAVAAGVGVLLVLLAGWVLVAVVPDEREALPYAVALLVAAALLLAASLLARRLAAARTRAARRASLATAALLVAVSLLLGQLGFVTVVLGLCLAFLALIADDPAGAAGGRERRR